MTDRRGTLSNNPAAASVRRGLGAGAMVVAASCLLASLQGMAHAEQPVLVAAAVRYEPGVGTADVRSECDWNRTIVETLVERSKRRVIASTEPFDLNRGTTLDLSIHSVHGAAGGGFAGPSWGTLRGELRENGKVVARFEEKKLTLGRWRFRACGALNKVAQSLGRFTANWLVESPAEQAKHFYGPPLDARAGAAVER